MRRGNFAVGYQKQILNSVGYEECIINAKSIYTIIRTTLLGFFYIFEQKFFS